MTWRPAYSLEQLRDEVNARWPARDKASDGLIGDAAHAASASDHNPNAAGVVCAFDITHDPHGPDGSDLAERLRLLPHPDVKYVIWNRRMFSAYARAPYAPFEWRPYTGADPHTNHVHVSVGVGPDGHSEQPYDDRAPAWLDASPPPVPVPPPSEEDDMAYFIAQPEGGNETGDYLVDTSSGLVLALTSGAYVDTLKLTGAKGPIPMPVDLWNGLKAQLDSVRTGK